MPQIDELSLSALLALSRDLKYRKKKRKDEEDDTPGRTMSDEEIALRGAQGTTPGQTGSKSFDETYEEFLKRTKKKK